MNALLQTERPKSPLPRPWGEQLFSRSLNHPLTTSQVILSVSGEPGVLFQRKHTRRDFPMEIPSGPVWVDRSGITGGKSLKRAPAFGPDRVIYAYPALHYPRWRAEFSILAQEFHAGAFGEGFTLTGVDEQTACIGDLIRVGSCRLQLSEPGNPDEWLYADRRKNIVDAARRENRIGWYYRIIEAGWVTAGDNVVLLKRPNPSWSVLRFSQIQGAADPTRKDLAELSTLEGLATDWQWAARKALKGLEQSLELFWGR